MHRQTKATAIPSAFWKKVNDGICWWYECSVCGEQPLQRYKIDCLSEYCPHCGAKMDLQASYAEE